MSREAKTRIINNMLYKSLIVINSDCNSCNDCTKCMYYLKSPTHGHNCKIAAIGDEMQHAPSDWDTFYIYDLLIKKGE